MSTQKPASSGPPLRALAMVLIALAILFAGLGFASLGSSDSEEAAPSLPATTTTSAPAAAATTPRAGGATSTSAANASGTSTTAGAGASTTKPSGAADALTQADKDAVPVRVLNNSSVTGLAGKTAAELTESGWTVGETGNYAEGTISSTTVYYGTSAAEKKAAAEIAEELGVTAEPRFPGIASSSPGVIVIVTAEG